MQFRTRWRAEKDQWTTEAPSISSTELKRLRQVLDRTPLIIEHWHYRGSSAPTRRVFDDAEDLLAYLEENAFAGDAIHCWCWNEVCIPERKFLEGECPAADGKVPRGGAY